MASEPGPDGHLAARPTPCPRVQTGNGSHPPLARTCRHPREPGGLQTVQNYSAHQSPAHGQGGHGK